MKLKSIAKSQCYVKDDSQELLEERTKAFIKGFNHCIMLIGEAIDEEEAKLGAYAFMGERRFALKMYRERVNKLLEELSDEKD